MIRLKCLDGKEVHIVKTNNTNNGFISDLTNFETLSKKVDILEDRFKSFGEVDLGNGTQVPAYGIRMDKVETAVGVGNYLSFQLTQNYEIRIYVRKSNVNVIIGLTASIYRNGVDIGGGISVITTENAAALFSGACTDVTYSNVARFMLLSNEDDIKKISTFAFCVAYQKISSYDWQELSMLTSYYYTYDSNKSFFNELRGANIIEEPDSQNVPDFNGDFDNTSDNVTINDINDINLSSSLQSNFVKCYAMSSQNLNDLSDYLWSDNFIDVIKKLQNDPIENIQKLCFYPFDVEKGAEANIIIGNADSNITAPRVVKQFQEIDFGDLQINEYYGNTLDYETDISIFLPFIGEKLLSAFDIMGGTINLKYRVDILTGACVAIISAVRVQNDVTLKSVLYTFSGDMSNEVPLTASQNNFLKSLVANPLDVKGTLTTALNGGLVSAIGGMSHSYSHTGNIGGNVGYLSVLTPYLIIRRPVNVKPADYKKTFGYPACTSVTLANQTGYCRYRECYFDNRFFDLEKEVCDEILNKLKTKGIYIK